MPKFIDTKQFVGPVEAFQIIGEECFGPTWKSSVVDDSEAAEHKTVHSYLYAALQSGDVLANWQSLDFRDNGDLQPQHVTLEGFFSTLTKTWCFIPRFTNPYIAKFTRNNCVDFFAAKTPTDRRPRNTPSINAKNGSFNFFLKRTLKLFRPSRF